MAALQEAPKKMWDLGLDSPSDKEPVEIDTHGVVMDFGKFAGRPVTHVPMGYLHWAVTNQVPRPMRTSHGTFLFWKIAKAEMDRRGARLQTVEVSAQAIDRLSIIFLNIWRATRVADEGLHTWAQRIALDAWKEHRQNCDAPLGTVHTVAYLGINWVMEELAIPVVRTVT